MKCVKGQVRRTTHVPQLPQALRRPTIFSFSLAHFSTLLAGAMSAVNASQIAAAVAVLEDALNNGVDVAIHF